MLKYVIVLLIFGLSGCAGSAPSVQQLPSVKRQPVSPGVPGTYHHVKKGETLWRISRMYNVELDEIVRINRIPDATSIEIGQQIFIPHRTRPVAPAVEQDGDDFMWPIRGSIVNTYGQMSGSMVNKGLDIAPASNKDVYAARSGKIVFYADDFGNFGRTVIIDHGDGFSRVYARNSETYIKAGDYVKKGQLIGRAGASGRESGVYLHFEIRKGHYPQNPLFYLPKD